MTSEVVTSEPEVTAEQKPRTVELVVQGPSTPEETCFLVFGSTSTTALCVQSSPELGRRVAALCKTEPEAEASPVEARLAGIAGKVVEHFGGRAPVPSAGVRTAVKVVVVDYGAHWLVWPPGGGVRTAGSTDELGRILAAVAEDKAQPRCPPGPVTSPWLDLGEQVMQTVAGFTEGAG